MHSNLDLGTICLFHMVTEHIYLVLICTFYNLHMPLFCLVYNTLTTACTLLILLRHHAQTTG